MAIGNNGLFNKAKLAKQDYSNVAEKEKTDIAVLVNDVDVAAGSRATSETQNQTLASQNKYSTTEETVVGTWIDNKPIYRKVITGLDISTTVNQWKEINVGINNMEYPINLICMRKMLIKYI